METITHVYDVIQSNIDTGSLIQLDLVLLTVHEVREWLDTIFENVYNIALACKGTNARRESNCTHMLELLSSHARFSINTCIQDKHVVREYEFDDCVLRIAIKITVHTANHIVLIANWIWMQPNYLPPFIVPKKKYVWVDASLTS